MLKDYGNISYYNHIIDISSLINNIRYIASISHSKTVAKS